MYFVVQLFDQLHRRSQSPHGTGEESKGQDYLSHTSESSRNKNELATESSWEQDDYWLSIVLLKF